MTPTTTSPSAFDAVLAGLRALYTAEVERLADHYRERILAGEFSGSVAVGDDSRYMTLERELKHSHPWLVSEHMRRVVLACTGWFERWDAASRDPETGQHISYGLEENDEMAPECLVHDVMAVAAARGWVRPLGFINADDIYALCKRPRRAA